MSRLRVVAWSTGTVGKHAIAGIDAHPDLDLVGVWVSDPAKVGRDAGELAGLGRKLGISATNDKAALYALAPDAVVHTAMTDDRIFDAIEDLIEILAHGINVVSSGPVLLCYPWGLGLDEYVERIEAACAAGGSSLHVNGIDPGFANDVLPLVTSSLCQRSMMVSGTLGSRVRRAIASPSEASLSASANCPLVAARIERSMRSGHSYWTWRSSRDKAE